MPDPLDLVFRINVVKSMAMNLMIGSDVQQSQWLGVDKNWITLKCQNFHFSLPSVIDGVQIIESDCR